MTILSFKIKRGGECQQITRHEKSLLEQTELKSEGVLLEEVSTYEKNDDAYYMFRS